MDLLGAFYQALLFAVIGAGLLAGIGTVVIEVVKWWKK